MSWNTVCHIDDILPNTGVAALLNDTQVAIFSVDGQLYAIGNKDPFSEANVLARGIVCSIGEQLTVASPIYKQHFSL
ncbi:MAG: nitrite reductase small subunit NirD, partial [Spongiibacteraceae bacterium]